MIALTVTRDGGFRFELSPNAAASLVFASVDMVHDTSKLLVIRLPYVKVPAEVHSALQLLVEVGVDVHEPAANTDGWPSKSPVVDERFLNHLRTQLEQSIDRTFGIPVIEEATNPAPEADCDRAVMMELLRGLASHNKMGENNHSHEDDFWKTRGQGLKPKQRHQIVRKLIAAKYINKKKNNSIGGTGWVYWIDDTAAVRRAFPELEGYFVTLMPKAPEGVT
jgi:hypothetical protein